MRRLMALLMAMVLMTGCALADWTCPDPECGQVNTEDWEYCRECGVDAPVHGLYVAMAGDDFLRLQWSGAMQDEVEVYIRLAGGSWSYQGSTTKKWFSIRELTPATEYELQLLDWNGDCVTTTAVTTVAGVPTATRVQELEAELAQRDAVIDALNTDVASLQADVTSRDTTITGLQADVAQRDAVIDALNTDVASLQADVTARDTTITALQADVAQRDNTIAELNTTLTAKDAELTALKAVTPTPRPTATPTPGPAWPGGHSAPMNGGSLAYCWQCQMAKGYVKPTPPPKAGDCITFGHYPQTASGTDNTPIEWLVLEVQGNKALIISKYGLDAKPYNTKQTSVTWETCTLRKWLNGEFMNKAFTAAEQNAILLTNVDNSMSQGYSGNKNTTGGNNTQDKVFLLSYAEAIKYFGLTKDDYNNTKSRVEPTAFAIKQGVGTNSDYKTATGAAAGWWWLRSPGGNQDRAVYVGSDGSLAAYYVYYTSISVRPAFWINLESGIF